jgi:MFS transporter, DHA1 family, tetracycline resistance protein
MVGYTLALVGVLSIIVQGGLIKKIVGALGERNALMFGLACGVLGFMLYALAPTGYWFWAAMPVAALWGIANPAAQALVSHQVDPREQGRLQGAIASLSAIAGIIAPTLFTRLLALVTDAHEHGIWAGAIFMLAAAMLAAGLLLAWYSSANLPVSTFAPPPESTVTSEILASTSDLQPPIDESQTRA